MTVKFLHVREVDEYEQIKSFGGLTVAYTIVDSPAVSGICINLVKCHPDDRFEYKVGRKLAAKKLYEEGPIDVLGFNHPISEVILDWLANQWFPSRRKYGGFSIDIFPDTKGRWLSDFTPSQEYITGDLD